MKRLFLIAALGAAGLHAQHLSVGILGGVPFTDVVDSYHSNTLTLLPTSSNFVVGPSIQVNLPLSLRIEVDALYRPYSFSHSAPFSSAHTNASEWNFPILLQYRFGTPVMSPFIEGGVAFNHLANLSAAATSIPSGPGALLHQSNAGVVLGGGVDLKIPFVRVSGELRYTHQGSAFFQQISNVNQAEFLLGLHF